MKRELVFSVTKKDLVITYFSGTGKGGQHRNKHMNCVRIKHAESGVIVTGQSSRSRKNNMREALNNLVNHYRFRLWCELKSSLDYKVTGMMKDVKVEKFIDGRWVEI